MTTTLFDLGSETTEAASSVKTSCDDNGLIQGADEVVEQLSTRLEPEH